ncbi:MAG: type I-C CRISPR-associated protein Cas7/Csd2, partial [Dialister pneumosintes]
KVDFIMTIEVNNANPNGDPLAGNNPRIDSKGYGEISDVCIKRKIRNRMQDEGYEIFVKSRERQDDGFNSLEERYNEFFKGEKDNLVVEKGFNEKWIDVRTFGQVITYEKKSIGIRGPVSISIGKSLSPIDITTMQIVRSTNGMEAKSQSGRSSDTMGTKHYVEYGVYAIYGSVNCFFAEKTGFDKDDLEVLKESLRTLFINDSSSARPEGSMEVKEIFWFEHSSKLGNVSSAKIRELVTWDKSDSEKDKYEDYNVHINEEVFSKLENEGLNLEIIQGI